MDDKYIGKLLDGRYEILDIAGVGGMAVVYKARDRALNRYVAIKVLKEEFAQDEEFRRRFYNESQTVARLSHHNIVSIYDVSQTEGLNYIVMELVDGISLKEYLQKRGRLTWQEALFFAQQIARALEHAHSRGIIHQDIKPHNIMILRDATAKVTDFGIARFAAKEETQVVKEAIGSVHYISPEQARGSTIDYRTDLYSLGVVMYEMLTGKLPFDGDNALAIVMQHISAMPLMPSEVVPGIPGGMNEIVMHAMCPAVNRRYSSASELYADLERLKSDPNMSFHYNIESRGETIEADETQKLPNFEVLNNIPIHHTPARPPADYAEKPITPVRRESSRNIYEERRSAPKPGERPPRERQSERVPPRRRQVEEDDDDGRFSDSPLLMVAVALLAIALIGGVAFFWFARFWGNTEEQIAVPSFIGAVYTEVLNDPQYENFRFLTEGRVDGSKPADTVIEQSPARGTMVDENSTITLYYAMEDADDEEDETIVMEDFEERELQVATDFLEKYDIRYTVEHDNHETIEEGRIIRTTPRSGQTILPNEDVLIVVSDGPDEGPFDMPNYYGMDLSTAMDDLAARGLTLKTSESRDTDMPKNAVVDQSPEMGTTVEKGDEVTLYYSSGKKPEDKEPDEPDTQDPDEGIGTGSIPVTLPPITGEAQVIIEMSGQRIWSEFYDTSERIVTITGLQGSIGTHDVMVTIIPPIGDAQSYETSITFS